MLASAIKLALIFLPWPVRRWLLTRLFRYDLHPTSRIGLSWIYPKQLRLREHARIGHLNYSKGLDLITLEPHATIGNLNWITAHPTSGIHFRHVPCRQPSLTLAEHAAITSQHFFDCASPITIGRFSTVAGLRSQFFTHGIDIREGRQDTRPIEIGAYCLVATGTVVLPGSRLPDHSATSALSLLNKQFAEPYYLYGGVPATPVKKLSADSRYFCRAHGFVE
jgi:acetyltransferase-like isoleucine patch superfamily enzyme